MNKKERIQLSSDFELEIEGTTLQIFYNGRPSGGMSGFGGRIHGAVEDLTGLLRQLANDIEREVQKNQEKQ